MVLALVLAGLSGCKKKEPPGHPPGSSYAAKTVATKFFKTPFQDESEFILQTVVKELATMVYFARNQTLPDAKGFSVSTRELPASVFRAPQYEVTIRLKPEGEAFRLELPVNGAIWSPEVYLPLTKKLMEEVGLEPVQKAVDTEDSASLLMLAEDASAKVLEQENQRLSGQLQKDFKNSALHQQAAFLIGVFAWREWSGEFYDVRLPLCRMAAHLTLARGLGKQNSPQLNLADAMLDTLMGGQAAALSKIAALESSSQPFGAWLRALKARNTGDYRPLTERKTLSDVERIAWFEAFSRSADLNLAWQRLTEAELRRLPDFSRIASTLGHSVETGHALLAIGLRSELQEVSTVYRIARGKELDPRDLLRELNTVPDDCVILEPSGQPRVQVISWGQWAMFLQRHLCNALAKNFNMLERKWGVPEEARKFAQQCDQSFADLRLYPFVRRFICTEESGYRKAVDDGFRVIMDTPHLVAPAVWNQLCFKVKFAPHYQPVSNPHVNEWHKHNPPPGTVYDLRPRINHPSLMGRSDTAAQLEKLHAMAPYHMTASYQLASKKHPQTASYEQLTEIYRPVLDYSVSAMSIVAKAAVNKPETYEALLTTAARVAPSYYFRLGEYFADRGQETKAAGYHQQGIDEASDAVLSANHSKWLMNYYLRQGAREKARKIADMAADAYSSSGLQTKAEFLELTGDHAGAFEWLGKVEERYGISQPLIEFCERYKARTGDLRYDQEVKQRAAKVFPQGLEQVKPGGFSGPPTDGVLLGGDSQLARSVGLQKGDVIVASYGNRVHNVAQYIFLRATASSDQVELVVWQPRTGYREVKASLPQRRFGVAIETYAAP